MALGWTDAGNWYGTSLSQIYPDHLSFNKFMPINQAIQLTQITQLLAVCIDSTD